jgi:dTDP-4-dehydrorhamnose reductase
MILVTGESGQLGTALKDVLTGDAVFLSRDGLDLADLAAIQDVIESIRPSMIVNAAAYTNVDRAEDEPELAMRINGEAVGVLAQAAAAIGARFITVSTDYVFDGTSDRGYLESDETNPLGAYGRSKEAGEVAAIAMNPETLVVRTSWLISGTYRNFAETMLRLARTKDLSVVDDQVGHPTLAPDLARGIVDAMDTEATGVLHLTNQGVTNWFAFAREIVELGGMDPERIQPCSSEEYQTKAPRPRNSVLESERLTDLGLRPLPDYHSGLGAVVAQLQETFPESV